MKRFGLVIFVLLLLEVSALGQGFFMTAFWQSPMKLAFTNAVINTNDGLCNAITVQSQNSGGGVMNAVTNTTIAITTASHAVFYSDYACTQPITSILLSSGTSAVTFYVLDTYDESIDVTVSATGYSSALQTETTTTNAFVWKGTTNSNWATGSNWSGGVVPGINDVAVFNSTCTNCSPTFTGAIDVKGLRFNDGYSGTFAQDAYNITVRAAGLTLMPGFSGTFTGATSALYNITSINGIVTISGGTFTAPVGSLIVHGGFRVYGTPTVTMPSGSTLDMECGSTTYTQCNSTTSIIKTGSVALQNLILHGRSTLWQLSNDVYVNGNLTFGDVANPGNGKITSSMVYVYGTALTQDNLGMQGVTSTVVLKGNASGTTVTGTVGGILPPLQIDSGVLNVTLSGTLNVLGFNLTSVGTLTTTGSTLNVTCPSTSYSYCYGVTTSLNFGSGLQTFNNVSLTGYSTVYDFASSTLVVTGTFSFGDLSTSTKSFTNGTVLAYGDVTLINKGNRASSSFDIYVKGNPAGQTINGSTLYYFPSLVIDSGTNAVTLNGTVMVSRFAMTSVGTFNVAGSTLDFECYSGAAACYGATYVLNLGNVAYNNLTIHGYASTLDLGGATPTVNGLLTFGDYNSVARSMSNGTIMAAGDIVQDNKGDRGPGSIQLIGNVAGQTMTGVAGMDWPAVILNTGANTVNVSGTIRTQAWNVTTVGTFNAGTSTIEIYCGSSWAGCYTGNVTLSFGGLSYNNLYFHGYATNYDFSGTTANVNGLLRLGDMNSTSRLLSNGTLNAYGDVTVDNNGYGGAVNLDFKGNASGQTFTGVAAKYVPAVVIDTGTNTLTLSGTIRGDAWTYLSGTVVTTGSTVDIVCNNSTTNSPTCYSTTATIRPGPVVYNNFNLRGYRTVWDLGGDTLKTSGLLTIGDQNLLRAINNGGLSTAGGLAVVGTVGNNGTATVAFTGSAAQSLNTASLPMPAGGTTVASTGGGKVTMATNVNVGSTLTVSSGTLDMAGFSLTVPSTLTINSGATLTKNLGALSYGSLVNNGTLNP